MKKGKEQLPEWFHEMLQEVAHDLENNPEEYQAIAQMMARDGEDPEHLYQWLLAGFKKMAAEARS